jgi:putative addiction module component (TIGR02574 family)
MTRTVEELRDEAMQLTDDERLVLGEHLLATVPPEPGYEEAWTREIERRTRDFEEGRTTGIPAEEVFARLRRRFK